MNLFCPWGKKYSLKFEEKKGFTSMRKQLVCDKVNRSYLKQEDWYY